MALPDNSRVIAVIDDTAFVAQPDANVEPGHQKLLISNTPLGRAFVIVFASIFTPRPDANGYLCIPHDYMMDERLLFMINLAAHVRMTAPEMMQLNLRLE